MQEKCCKVRAFVNIQSMAETPQEIELTAEMAGAAVVMIKNSTGKFLQAAGLKTMDKLRFLGKYMEPLTDELQGSRNMELINQRFTQLQAALLSLKENIVAGIEAASSYSNGEVQGLRASQFITITFQGLLEIVYNGANEEVSTERASGLAVRREMGIRDRKSQEIWETKQAQQAAHDAALAALPS